MPSTPERGALSSRRLRAPPPQGPPEPTRVSLRFEPAPPEGPLRAPHVWDDLLEGEPPWRSERPAPAWCVPGPEVFEGGLRLELPLVVTATEQGLWLEDRLAVTPRTLAGAIETERERVAPFVRRAHVRIRRARRRRVRMARELRERGGAYALLGILLAGAAAVLHRVGASLLHAARASTKWAAALPDRLGTGLVRSTDFLATPVGRKRFREGLLDPRNLSPRQKAVTLFTGVGAILVGLLLVHAAVTLVVPQHAVAWRRMFLLFVYSFVTSLGPPLPLEPVLLGASLYVGRPVTLATVLAAKVLAAWMVFFLGDEVNDKLREKQAKHPWIGRFLDASEAFARRFGVLALATFIAVPGLPDVVALYLFGTLQMTLKRFLVGVAIGGFVLYSTLLYGVGPLLGLH